MNNYNIPGTWTRLPYTYRNVSVCTGFYLDAVVTFSRVQTFGTNQEVPTAPIEKLVHADTILFVSLCLFHVPDKFTLFTLSLNNFDIQRRDLCREFMSIYLGVTPHHNRLPWENFTLRLPRPAVAWIHQTRGLGGSRTVASLVTYHRTTSHRYTRVSHKDKECKLRMNV